MSDKFYTNLKFYFGEQSKIFLAKYISYGVCFRRDCQEHAIQSHVLHCSNFYTLHLVKLLWPASGGAAIFLCCQMPSSRQKPIYPQKKNSTELTSEEDTEMNSSTSPNPTLCILSSRVLWSSYAVASQSIWSHMKPVIKGCPISAHLLEICICILPTGLPQVSPKGAFPWDFAVCTWTYSDSTILFETKLLTALQMFPYKPLLCWLLKQIMLSESSQFGACFFHSNCFRKELEDSMRKTHLPVIDTTPVYHLSSTSSWDKIYNSRYHRDEW